jgi:hypothetical protein
MLASNGGKYMNKEKYSQEEEDQGIPTCISRLKKSSKCSDSATLFLQP